MKVALLKKNLEKKGGLEKYALRIASAFLQKGFEVSFLTEKPIPLKIAHSVLPVSPYLPKFLQIEQFDRKVTNWLSKYTPDIAFGMDRNRNQTHFRVGNGVHAAFLKSRIAVEGKAKYALCYVNPLHLKILQIEKEAFQNPLLRKIFVNSHMVQKEILAYYNVDPKKIEVIHNGVEWKEHAPFFHRFEEGRNAALQYFGLDPNRLHLLFIGNGYKRKGLDSLLQALSIWEFNDFHLSVIGKEKNLDWYQWKTKKLSLENRIRFFGSRQDVIPFYQMADVLVIPSFYDPFANVTLEGLSFGLFIISSKTNGGAEVLTKENGICIEDMSKPESLLSALNHILQRKKTYKSASAIRNSIAHLDFSIQLSKLIDACH